MASGRKSIIKVPIIGDAGVGKSCLLNQFVNRRWTANYRTTIGTDLLVKEIVVDGQLCSLQLWDTAGSERFQSLGNAFYRGSEALVVVFDVTRPETLEHVAKWRDDFLLHANVDNAETFPIAVLGNKIDTNNRAITQKKALEFCQSLNATYFEVSAREAINVEQAFQTVSKMAMDNQMRNPWKDIMEGTSGTIKIDPKPADGDKTCCFA